MAATSCSAATIATTAICTRLTTAGCPRRCGGTCWARSPLIPEVRLVQERRSSTALAASPVVSYRRSSDTPRAFPISISTASSDESCSRRKCAQRCRISIRKPRSASPIERADGRPRRPNALRGQPRSVCPNHPVMITDRISMAHGLEARSPFMDHELASSPPAALYAEDPRRHAALHAAQARRALSAAEILIGRSRAFPRPCRTCCKTEYARLYESACAQSQLVHDRVLDRHAIIPPGG